MDIKPYKNPNEEGEGGFVSEPVVAYPVYSQKLDLLKHQVMEAVLESEDSVSLVFCLNMLTQKHGHHHVTSGKSDEELAAILASTSDWDDKEHTDLSQIDYSKYKAFKSNRVKQTIEKWL